MEHLNTQQEGERQNSRSKRKEMCGSVKVWDSFSPFTDKNGKQRAKCKYCDRTYIVDRARNENGTAGMNNHVRICKNNPDSEFNKTSQGLCHSFSVSGDIKEEESSSSDCEYDEQAIRKSLVCMIIIDQLPFGFVEGEGFKKFMSVACPHFVIPSRTEIARECYKMYVDEKNKLTTYFRTSGQRVSLSIDTWISNRSLTYLCLTSHYIDDSWKLHRTMLNFVPCCFQKGGDVGSLIEDCLREWEIDRIFTVTVDNASSSDTIAYLRSRFVDWGTAILDGKFLHMKCLAHIVNIVVKDELSELNESIERVRALVSYVRQSPSKMEKFNEFVAEEKVEGKTSLCLDVPTRWDSTYRMLDTAVNLKSVFDKYEVYDVDLCNDFIPNIGLPTKRDWIVVKRLVKVLRYFYELTRRVSGSSIVTSNDLFDEIIDLDNIFKKWVRSDDADLVDMARKMKFKFDEYWGEIEKMNTILYIAVMLDPRYKFFYVEYMFKEMYGDERGERMANVVKDAFRDVFNEYENLYPDDDALSVPEESTIKSECGDNFESSSKAITDRRKKYIQMIYEMGRANQSELDMYLRERSERDSSNFDVLDWWKMNGSRFPVLSRLARDVFAVPISTVNLECAFSIGTPQIDDYRASLTPGFTQALICCQDWLRDAPVESAEDDWEEIERIEIDMLSSDSKSWFEV